MIKSKNKSDEGTPSETAINEILLKPVSYTGVSAALNVNQQVLSQPNSPRKGSLMQDISDSRKKDFSKEA